MKRRNNPFLDDYKDIEAFLQNNIADFAITTLIFYEGDEHIIAEVNNDLIFRFAKTIAIQKHMCVEIELLKYLKNRIRACSIPHVIYYFPEMYCFGYKKIKGNLLSKEVYASLSHDQQNKLANDVAQFLYELHSNISLEEAQNTGLVFADWPLLPKDLKNKISLKNNNRLNTTFEKFINEYEQILDTEHGIVIHNDIHEKNVVINAITNKLSGIIDFTSACIGTKYHEFRYLHLIDEIFLKNVVVAYSERSQFQVSLHNAYIFCMATEFSRLTERSYLSYEYEKIVKRIYALELLL
jgi:aminoglycoside phosphotransferase